MILSIYSMRDVHTGFMAPTFEVNDQVAVRNFVHAVTNAGVDSVLSSHFADFSLYRLGTFDSDSGKFESILPEFLISGVDAWHPASKKEDS